MSIDEAKERKKKLVSSILSNMTYGDDVESPKVGGAPGGGGFHPSELMEGSSGPLPVDGVGCFWESDGGEELEGGLGDNASMSEFCYCQVIAGMAVEMEHTDDVEEALEITLDHLSEDEYYYSTVIPLEEVASALKDVYRTVAKKARSNRNQYETMTAANMGLGGTAPAIGGGSNLVGQPPRYKPATSKRHKQKKKKKRKKA